ncbi:hypothetical protein MY10362_002000 [Beauveria mimosiformis]
MASSVWYIDQRKGKSFLSAHADTYARPHDKSPLAASTVSPAYVYL